MQLKALPCFPLISCWHLVCSKTQEGGQKNCEILFATCHKVDQHQWDCFGVRQGVILPSPCLPYTAILVQQCHVPYLVVHHRLGVFLLVNEWDLKQREGEHRKGLRIFLMSSGSWCVLMYNVRIIPKKARSSRLVPGCLVIPLRSASHSVTAVFRKKLCPDAPHAQDYWKHASIIFAK